MIDIRKKDDTVNLEVNRAFEAAAPVLRTAWIMMGLTCIVTSGKDGVHSKQSAHYSGNALDLRIIGISNHMAPITFGSNLAAALFNVCGQGFYVVLEKDHIHLEYSQGVPNIKGFKAGKFFYDGLGK